MDYRCTLSLPTLTHVCTGDVCSARLQIDMDDLVVLDGYQGHVRYIGHMDEPAQANAIYVGVELDSKGKLTTGEMYYSFWDRLMGVRYRPHSAMDSPPFLYPLISCVNIYQSNRGMP